MKEDIIAALHKQIEGLMYLSEYEYPITFFPVDATREEDIPAFLAAYKNADESDIKNIGDEHFFARFENYLSHQGPDILMNENAQRFLDLHLFLKENFSEILVYRIEKSGVALIPVFIIAKFFDGSFIGLESTAMET